MEKRDDMAVALFNSFRPFEISVNPAWRLDKKWDTKYAPVIGHELFHRLQCVLTLWIGFQFLAVPLWRQYTLEWTAYMVQDAIAFRLGLRRGQEL